MAWQTAFFVVVAYVAGALLLTWAYFGRYRLTRPPIGVFNLRDVALMIGAVILVPYLYLAAPVWLVAALLGIATLSILQLTCEPILPGRWLAWLAGLVLLAVDVLTGYAFGWSSTPFLLANNSVLAITVTGATNLWVQSGMKARDVAALAAALVVYDFVATSLLPLTNDLTSRLEGLPFAPQVAWVADDGRILGIGLGDLLLAAVFPLAMRKAFGRTAGLLALALCLAMLAALLSPFDLLLAEATLPAMVALGPLMLAQYFDWRHHLGPERTTW